MKPLQEKYDVTIRLGHISYDDDYFSGKLTVHNGTDPEEIARAEFDRNVWRYEDLGLKEGMYGIVFIGRNHQGYALTGFNPKSKKYPLLIVQISDGAEQRCGKGFLVSFTDQYYRGDADVVEVIE